MSAVGVFVLSLLLSAYTKAAVPSGYILQITPNCGADGVADGSVDIVTDLNANAKAVCMGDNEVDFTTTDSVNFALPFSYQGGSETEPCVFVKRADAKVYAARVLVSYGEPGSLVHQYTEEYTITCTFDGKGDDESATHTVDETLIAAKEIQTNVGSASGSTIALELVDVLGDDLAGQNVGLGRWVQLCATLTGSESGIRPVSCDAIDSTSARYAILRAGCGDGIVFGKDVGFTSHNKHTRSPYFEAFSINVDNVISFECNFTLCAANCNGNSCDVEAPSSLRRRRSDIGRVTPYEPEYALASTLPVRISSKSSKVGVGSVQQMPKN